MHKFWKAATIIGTGLAPVGALAALASSAHRPFLLYNATPSEPIGLYRTAAGEPKPGQIIAFKVPQTGRPYAETHLGNIARNAILKEIVAGEGTEICERAGMVRIGGKVRGEVLSTDRHGTPLPHWTGCHRLQHGQYFVLSNRIPNSFDSRYYGPVSETDLVGVYRPLWTE